MERKEITSKELKNLIREQIQQSKSRYSHHIEIDNYVITDSFDRLPANLFGKKVSSKYTISFNWCTFNRTVNLKNTSENEITFRFTNVEFKESLIICGTQNSGNVQVRIDDSAMRGYTLKSNEHDWRESRFDCLQAIVLSGFSTPAIEISFAEWLSGVVLNLFDVSTHSITFSDVTKLSDIKIHCHEELVPIISRFFPTTPFQSIYTYSNYWLGKK